MTTSPCPACRQNTFVSRASPPNGEDDEGTCTACGYAAGESNRCPHCGAVARLERKGRGRHAVCAVCGRHRIAANLGGAEASAALKEEDRALAMARAASVATILQALLAAAVTLVALVVAPSTVGAQVLAVVLTLAPVLLALRGRSRSAKARASAWAAGERAWLAAAESVVSSAPEGVTTEGLAKVLEIDAADAEKLLSQLAVHDRTRIDVGDDAEVRYSVQLDAPLRARDEPPFDVEGAREEETTESKGRVR